MDCKSGSPGERASVNFTITHPGSKDIVVLETGEYEIYAVHDPEKNICQVFMPLGSIDAAIEGLKRAAHHAKLLQDS
jgi:hypothetical protein